MNKVYDDAKDKNVGAVVVYGDSTDGKLYVEASGANKTQVTDKEAKDLFIKGRLIIDVAGDLFAPVNVIGSDVTTAGLVESTVTLTKWAVATTN